MLSAYLLVGLAFLTISEAMANCTTGMTACDPRPSCCAVGEFCNFNVGIPVCELNDQTGQQTVLSGFSGMPCSNPYLWDCSPVIGVAGVCCPIGSICFTEGQSKDVSCIDAYGSSTPALSESNTTFRPSYTLADDAALKFSPSNSWSSHNGSNCTLNTETQITNVVNASVSFNFTGPSIIVQTVLSPQGGVFGIVIDDFLLEDFIDTFNADGEACSPIQYPPFVTPPPNFGSTTTHSITLFYQGPSSSAPNGSITNGAVFDAFAVPEFSVPAAQLSSDAGSFRQGMSIGAQMSTVIHVFLAFIGLLLIV